MNQHIDPPYYDNLDEALDYAFAMLAAGVKDRRSGFHTPAVATVNAQGAPAVRTVVLRRFEPAERMIAFHTDMRTRKPKEIAANAHIGVHFYDAGRKLQLRADCIARLEHGTDLARAAWDASRAMSRACYAQAVPPGDPLEHPGDYAQVTPLDDEDAFANFAVVRATILRLEWLYLSSKGHRRALFDWRSGALKSMWLAP